jgi:hypothetical protein
MSINLPHPLSDDMRALAGRSLDAAEATLERTADTALEAVRFIDLASAGWKQGATDLQLKALEIAENNAQACLRYWRGLLSVSAPAEFQEFNYGFLGDQSAVFLRQSFELGHLALRLAVDIRQSFAGLKSSSFSA